MLPRAVEPIAQVASRLLPAGAAGPIDWSLRPSPHRAILRGEVAQLAGEPIEWPARPPPLAAAERIAVATLAVEELRRYARPVRLLYELGRSFWLRDASGRALVRFDDADRGEREIHIAAPPAAGHDGPREVFLRGVRLGDEVVVAGRVEQEIDAGGAGSYREAPTITVIYAEQIYDGAAWVSLCEWRALPWHRKLSLIVRNR
jgi:hypothetical protein